MDARIASPFMDGGVLLPPGLELVFSAIVPVLPENNRCESTGVVVRVYTRGAHSAPGVLAISASKPPILDLLMRELYDSLYEPTHCVQKERKQTTQTDSFDESSHDTVHTGLARTGTTLEKNFPQNSLAHHWGHGHGTGTHWHY